MIHDVNNERCYSAESVDRPQDNRVIYQFQCQRKDAYIITDEQTNVVGAKNDN